MDMGLFQDLLRDYHSIGGGYLSLTPTVGDFLLDRHLSERMVALKGFENSVFPTVTTNLYALDRWSDETVMTLLNLFNRVHVR